MAPSAARLEWKRFLLLQCAVWTTYGVIHFAAALPAIAPDEHGVIALAKAVRALTGMLVSSMLLPLLRWKGHPYRKGWWLVLAAAAISAGFAWTLLDRAALVTAAGALRLAIPWDRFVHGMDLDYFFVMLAWTGGVLAFKRQADMQAARLDLLAARLNPHFLFNSLNTIRSLAAEDPERTREVVSRLSSFLRRVIAFDPAVPVPIEEEIALARDYLSVEEARFEAGVEVGIDVDPAVAGARVPPLILQPLLENAFRHGDADEDGVRRIAVAARRAGSMLELMVANTGTLDAGGTPGGVGLPLTRSRLEQVHGARASLSIDGKDGTVTARIRMPMEEAGW